MKRKSYDDKIKKIQNKSKSESRKYMDHKLDEESRSANALTENEKFEQQRDQEHKLRREKYGDRAKQSNGVKQSNGEQFSNGEKLGNGKHQNNHEPQNTSQDKDRHDHVRHDSTKASHQKHKK